MSAFRILPAVFVALFVAACSTAPKENAGPGGEESAPAKVTQPTGPNAALRPRTSPLRTGSPVPPFTMADQKGRPVSAAELTAAKGSLLLFVPTDASPAARPAYEYARRHQSLLSQRGVEVLLVTPDSVDVNARVAAREGLRLAVLSDPGSRVARAFGIIPEGQAQAASAWMFVLGGDQRIHLASSSLADVSSAIMAAETRPGAERESAIPGF